MQNEVAQTAKKLGMIRDRLVQFHLPRDSTPDSSTCMNTGNPLEAFPVKRRFEPFGRDSEEVQRVYTPQAQSKKHKKSDPYQTITQLWVKLSQSQQYEELSQTIIGFQLKDQKMADFFDQKGSYLLRCAILYWSQSEPLRFICENVPKDILQKVLRQEEYGVLKGLLLGETALEKKGKVHTQMLAERFEKISLLLAVDFEGLKAYMESESFKIHYAPGVKESFRAAIAEHELRQSTTPKY